MKLRLLLFFVLMLAAPMSIFACQCLTSPGWDSKLNQIEKYNSAEVIFVGEVISQKGIRTHPELVPDIFEITFKVEKYYKQPASSDSAFTIRTMHLDCEHSYRIGQKWLILAKLNLPGFYNANICTPSGKFTDHQLTKEKPARFYKFLTEELPAIGNSIKIKHQNGKLALKGSYKNHLPHGEFIAYNETGKLKDIAHYENGFLTDFTKFKLKKGVKDYETTIHQDRRFFSVKYFREDGKLKSEQSYLENEFIEKQYYENEVLKSEVYSIKGSDFIKKYKAEYFENGAIKEKGWTENNQKTGEWVYGTEDGKTEVVTYP